MANRGIGGNDFICARPIADSMLATSVVSFDKPNEPTSHGGGQMFSKGFHRIPATSLIVCVCVLVSFTGCTEMPSDGNVSDSNPPIANAGEVQTVLKNASVRLDGSASFDPNGRDLNFQWSRTSGPLITLVGSRTAHPTFEAPALGHNVTLEFKLEVGNGSATAEGATAVHVVQTEPETLSRMCDEPNLPLHPLVEFIVEPDDGPGPLTIDCTAITSDGSELPWGPDVTYTWTIDGEADSGPMETHANRSFVLSSSGAHTVTLCLTLSGLSWGCLDAQNAGQRERAVFVWPRISGIVHDGTEGIPGVAVAANNVPGGATDVTDSQGEYELSVPFGWSGVITPHHVDYDFQPASLEQVETTTNVSNQDFVAAPSGSTGNGVYDAEDLAELLGSWGPCEGCTYDLNGNGEVDEEDLAILLANWGDPDDDGVPDPIDPPEQCTSDLDCDDGNFCNGPETCVDSACLAGMDPCPAQMCDEAGEACVDCLADSDCDDGTFCNGAEDCVSGLCEAGSNSCPGQLCDEDTDSCFDQACSVDADCDDNLFCNGTETCVNGLCASASAPCSGQQCDEDSAACVECLVDADCDDGGFCNGAETCQANSCVPGTDPCPGQMCDGLGDVCADCLRNSDCDDGAYCNGAERCQSGSCVNGTAPCSGQTCDEASDSCMCSTDADCDDGSFCNGAETCVNGNCVAGSNPCPADEVCLESTDECINGAAWTPPIGIPMPEFGIFETHDMYANATYDFGNGSEPYRDAGNGPYTHYIDNTHPSATNSNNPFGTPDSPRLTIPGALAAGSVVEIHGGPYTGSQLNINASGTITQPIFARGVDPQDPPIFRKFVNIQESSHFIIESIKLDAFSLWVWDNSHHISIHGCEITNGNGFFVGGRSADIVFYNNYVHDLSGMDAPPDQDPDSHGVHISKVDRLWVVDNTFHHCSGDAVQVGGQAAQFDPDLHPQFIYIGRNLMHHNRQTGAWSKVAGDVIISQNTMYAMGENAGVGKPCTGSQYGPERLWHLYNDLSDCADGIRTGMYAIGNVVHSTDGWGIQLSSAAEAVAVANTIYDVDGGITVYGVDGAHVVDNIISAIRDPGMAHVKVAGAPVMEMNHTLFYQNGNPVKILWSRNDGTGAFDVFDLPGFLNADPDQCRDTSGNIACWDLDPLFVAESNNDFRLQPGSPAIDAGTDHDVYDTFFTLYGLDIRVDFNGIIRPKDGDSDGTPSFDIGASEND